MGVAKNLSRARALFEKSAAQGDVVAENSLGWMYENGVGVQQDNAQAIAWYQKSAAQGDSTAKERLAALNQQTAVPPQKK